MARFQGEDERAFAALSSPKVKSAGCIDRPLDLRGWDFADDAVLRPVTTASAIKKKMTNPPSRGGKKPLIAIFKTPADAVQIDGWGDFDADHLLRPDVELEVEVEGERGVDASVGVGGGVHPQVDNEAHLKLQRRASRIEALARPSEKPLTPVTTREPSRQVVLRQRSIAVIDAASPKEIPLDPLHSPAKSVSKKSLVIHHWRRDPRDAHTSTDAKLPTLTKPFLTPQTTPIHSRGVGLFGPHIDDSLDVRERMFQRFLPVWSLLPSRLPVPEKSSNNESLLPRSSSASLVGMTTIGTKSPYECSMLLTKICKAVGIALTASPPPDVWSTVTKRRGSSTTLAATSKPHTEVDLETFGELIVRNALQPAMHHYKLDRDVDEYVHTLDAVVQSLLTKVEGGGEEEDSVWRLRELFELQAVMPLWKKGMLFVQKQMPLVKTSPSATAFRTGDAGRKRELPDTEPLGAGDNGLHSTEPSGGDPSGVQAVGNCSSHAMALLANEARAMQDANIRRKVQLRKSWHTRVQVTEPLAIASLNQPLQSMQPLARVTDAVHASAASLLDSCIHVEAVPRLHSFGIPHRNLDPTNNQVSEVLPTPVVPSPDETLALSPLLLCGSCPDEQEARLWCSACFAVYCMACWTTTHHSTVDLSVLTNQHELPIPSARPMQTQRDRLAPPVAMVYLPTKPVANGKLLRGPTKVSPPTNQSDDPAVDSSDVSTGEETLLTYAMSSHVILPALKPPHQKPGLLKTAKIHHSTPALTVAVAAPASAMDSTANLLKALMLGTASSASVLGSSTSPSPWSIQSSETRTRSSSISTTADHQEPTRRRTQLEPKAVTLDATALFP